MDFKSTALLLLVLTPAVYCANILMLPVPHHSHVNVMCIAGKLLQDAGHNVTVIVQNSNKKSAQDRGLSHLNYTFSEKGDLPAKVAKIMFKEQGIMPLAKLIISLKDHMLDMCKETIENKEVLEAMETTKFDLMFITNINLFGCLYALPYKYRLPYISFGAFSQPLSAGMTALPANELPLLLSAAGDLSFTKRMFAPLVTLMWEYIIPFYLTPSSTFQKLVPHREPTTFPELLSNSILFLITLDSTCFGDPKLTAPNFVYIGSLSITDDAQPLSEDVRKFADAATDGLILMAFGSWKSDPEQQIQRITSMIKALGDLKENAILQCDPEYFQNTRIPSNIMLKKWLPQKALLAHENTKLFIGHGGMYSVMESIYQGIPILVIPKQVEQLNNGQLVEDKNFGKLVLNISDSDLIRKTVRELIDNPLYTENIQRCSKIQKDLPSAKDQLVFWTNHVLKFGGSHLRPHTADMPLYKMFMLDVLMVYLVFFILMIYISVKLLLIIYRKCCKRAKHDPKTKSD